MGGVCFFKVFFFRAQPFCCGWFFLVFFFALAMSVFLYHKGWGSLFFAAALFISMARIMGGIHWPSDVLGGAVLGISIALCIHFLAVGSNFVKRQKGNLPSEAGL